MPKIVDNSPFESSAGSIAAPLLSNFKSKIQKGWIEPFLSLIMQGASVTDATAQLQIDITTPYKARATDPAFKQAWTEAGEIGTEFLEQEAARRAYHGTLEPVYHKGQVCGTIRRYSDILLMFLLKKRDPSYRDGGSLTINNDVKVLNLFEDIERNVKLIEQMDGAAEGGVRENGHTQPVHATQPDLPQAEPEADRLLDADRCA